MAADAIDPDVGDRIGPICKTELSVYLINMHELHR